MGRLIYSMITSLDGFVADADGRFDWSEPDEEVHAAANDLMRPIGTHLYGRRLYEVMSAWQTMDVAGEPAVIADFAELWRSAHKVVFSTSLAEVPTPRTRIERRFDPAAVAALVREAERDVLIGGPGLASAALLAGLVDEVHVFVSPIVVGGGTPALPAGLRLPLSLHASRTFGNGVVHLAYSRLG